VNVYSLGADGAMKEKQDALWIDAAMLLVWLAAGVVAFLPFAVNTSPWDAVTFRVPGDQGNWWHFLAGAPFFLAFPMIWLRLRSLLSSRLSTPRGRRVMWAVAGCSVAGTILVELPFLFHLAGTGEWQRLIVLSLGFGIVIASGVLLFSRLRRISPTHACMIALGAAYLANAALCLVVYSDAVGNTASRSGWFVTAVIVWPMSIELIARFAETFRTLPAQR
jgi:hypothetical protein